MGPKMKKRQIILDAKILLTPSFKSTDSFSDLVEDFLVRLPGFTPQRWGFVEPINLQLTPLEIREALRSGSSDIMWKRNLDPKGWGVFKKRTFPLRGPQSAGHYLSFSLSTMEQVTSITSYIKGLTKIVGVEYAFCDTRSDGYKDAAALNGLAPYKGSLNVFTHSLTQSLPDVLWAQVFGPAYVEMFGMEKLMSTPAYRVEQLRPDAVYIQLTESLFDLHECYAEVDAVRERVKKHLDDNIFFNPGSSAGHVYKVPVFQFPE